MEYLTLLNYLYVITYNSRKRVAKKAAFFLSRNLTPLNNLYHIKHQSPSL